MKNTSPPPTILGAIAGDIIGSFYEGNNVKTTDFDLLYRQADFTDDTVLTVAVADSILHDQDFAKTLHAYGNAYFNRGYGASFRSWLSSDNPQPYGSWGNGSAMRVSPVGFIGTDLAEVKKVAKQTAEVTHNHPEGIKGAQAVASAVFLAKNEKSREEIKTYVTAHFRYNLAFTLDSIRPSYQFDVSCQGSVPQAIVAFLESKDYESAVRLAISIGGDSDTIACMTGGIAAAFYKKIPSEITEFVTAKLPMEFRQIISEFDTRVRQQD